MTIPRGMLWVAAAISILLLKPEPAGALYAMLPPQEIEAAIRFGLAYSPLRWPGEDGEWHREVPI